MLPHPHCVTSATLATRTLGTRLRELPRRTAEIPGKSAWVGKFGLASYRCPNNPEFEDWFCTAHICHPDSLHEFCGSLYVSVKLPTYPFPKQKLTLSSYLGQNFGLGKG